MFKDFTDEQLEMIAGLDESRILKLSKDDLRMDENQILWSDELQAEVLLYWGTLNSWWNDKKIPPCTCADKEGGFMAKEKFNPYWYEGEPCNIKLYQQFKSKGE